MVQYRPPNQGDIDLAMKVVAHAIRMTLRHTEFCNGDGKWQSIILPEDSFEDEDFYDAFSLNKIIVNNIEVRESQDVLICSLRSNNENCFTLFKYARGNFNQYHGWITQYKKEEFKQSPILEGELWFNGDDKPAVQLLLSVEDKEIYYREYIHSEKWRLFRNKIFALRGFKCELCGVRKNLQLHHVNYERLGNEHELDVMILCGVCHNNAHKQT
jgi:hypothetical protein